MTIFSGGRGRKEGQTELGIFTVDKYELKEETRPNTML
jgi:hypothetical protein